MDYSEGAINSFFGQNFGLVSSSSISRHGINQQRHYCIPRSQCYETIMEKTIDPITGHIINVTYRVVPRYHQPVIYPQYRNARTQIFYPNMSQRHF